MKSCSTSNRRSAEISIDEHARFLDRYHDKGQHPCVHPVKTLSWYKQFWPWFLISLPSPSIASIVTINIAIRTDDGLVSDDYKE